MRVIEIAEPGGPEVLRLATRPVPEPVAGEILIRVRAAGVNRPDALQRAGSYAPPPGASDLPGLEAAGEVAAVGPGGGSPWKVGDAVCALLPGGGYAEYALTHQDHALPVPDRHGDGSGGRALRDVLHGLGQRLRARPAGGGRGVPGPWRVVGHRHDGDPAGGGARRAGIRDRRIGGEVPGVPRPGGGARDRLSRPTISCRRCGTRPAGAGST